MKSKEEKKIEYLNTEIKKIKNKIEKKEQTNMVTIFNEIIKDCNKKTFKDSRGYCRILNMDIKEKEIKIEQIFVYNKPFWGKLEFDGIFCNQAVRNISYLSYYDINYILKNKEKFKDYYGEECSRDEFDKALKKSFNIYKKDELDNI